VKLLCQNSSATLAVHLERLNEDIKKIPPIDLALLTIMLIKFIKARKINV
jgi:hypothetical protein